jgi:nucleoside-diphosphate-sugar epimerase
LERASLFEALDEVEVVFHLAGVTRARNLDDYRPVNVEATRQVGLAAKEAGARLVHVSSQAAAGLGSVERPRLESDPPEPVSDYGRSKLLGEEAVQEIEGLEWAIVRPSAVYGPRDRDFETLFRLAAKGVFPLTGPPDSAYSMIYVEDLAQALEVVGRSPEVLSQVVFVSHPEPNTSEELLRSLAQLFERPYKPLHIHRAVLWTGMLLGRLGFLLGRPPLLTESRYRELTAGDFVCSTAKLSEIIGSIGSNKMVSLREGLRRTRAWHASARDA